MSDRLAQVHQVLVGQRDLNRDLIDRLAVVAVRAIEELEASAGYSRIVQDLRAQLSKTMDRRL